MKKKRTGADRMDDDAGPIYRLASAARPMPTKRSTSKATQLTVSREDDGATRPSESLCFATKLSPFFFSCHKCSWPTKSSSRNIPLHNPT